ncbi:unnamed protein product [Penicillium camemberti]|uniref:Str. FM013 n=1 Tax=Penicillium camemberti (strain FM 013) TaxID=1429867 RepID=A0A0G4PXH8_PENC3|nr:unnamed protein product [Penicillium camemberti]
MQRPFTLEVTAAVDTPRSGRHVAYHYSDRFTEGGIDVPNKTTQSNPAVRPL